MFFQIEGFIVDEGITLRAPEGRAHALLHALFGADVPVRFRPSYFPFVEPGGEVDICRNGRWIEILGCGMIHPVVLEHVGFDPERSAASPSAWASIAWRCSATASTTSSSSTKTTCAPGAVLTGGVIMLASHKWLNELCGLRGDARRDRPRA